MEETYTAGAALGSLTQVNQSSARTFDSISSAVVRVRATVAQVEQMLGRVAPEPREVSSGADNTKPPGRQPYAYSLKELDEELNQLGHALDRLEKHV